MSGSEDSSRVDWTAERPAWDVDACEDATAFVRRRIDENLDRYADAFPTNASEDLRYGVTDEEDWTPSFWTGMLWLAYELTGDEQYRTTAQRHVELFESRLREGRDVTNHDLGFVYTLSCVAAYRLMGDEIARGIAVEAAKRLTERFHDAPGILQCWGDPADPGDHYGRMIVDTMMNLPLLYWASETTGEPRFREIATSHARRTAEHLVRDDGSTFHTFRMDPETGEPLGGSTHQGYADDSCWSRGQAWTIYGLALSARYTGDEAFVEHAKPVADYYLEHLADDHVPHWDFDVVGEDDQRDSSAGAIAACGLAELARQLPLAAPRRRRYENAALETLRSLAADYTTEGLDSNGVLAHGVYSKPGGDGVGECCLWGDYFYLEGLVRAGRNWNPYW